MTVQRHHHMGDLAKRDVVASLASLTDADEVTWTREQIDIHPTSWTASYGEIEVGLIFDVVWSLHIKENGAWSKVYGTGARRLGRAVRRQQGRVGRSDMIASTAELAAQVMGSDPATVQSEGLVAYLAALTQSEQLTWRQSEGSSRQWETSLNGVDVLVTNRLGVYTVKLVSSPMRTKRPARTALCARSVGSLVRLAKASATNSVRQLTPMERKLSVIVQAGTQVQQLGK